MDIERRELILANLREAEAELKELCQAQVCQSAAQALTKVRAAMRLFENAWA